MSDFDPVEKPWLVILHGFSQNSKVFALQQAYFQSKYRLFCPDLRGHGVNSTDRGPFGIAEYYKDILGQLEERGIVRANFWGTHTGSAVGLLLAIYHPDRIASLVLEAPVITDIELRAVAQQFQQAKSTAKTSGVQVAVKDWFDQAPWFKTTRENPIEFREEAHRQLIYEFMGSPLLSDEKPMVPPLVLPYLSQLKQEVLIYNGSKDVEEFMDLAALLKEKIPRAKKIIVDDAGGFPFWEKPTQVNQMVDVFLQEIAIRGAC